MKAKVIIDMPAICDDCPLALYTGKFMVWECAAKDGRELIKINEKPDWCPLEPIIEPTTVYYTVKGPPFGEPVASDRFNAAVELLKTDPAIISTDELESCLRGDEYDTGWEK